MPGEDWPTWERLLVRCRNVPEQVADGPLVAFPAYYLHSYSFDWTYQHDGLCPYHPDGYRRAT